MSEHPAPDLGALPPLTPEERRQYCSRIVDLDRPGLMRLVGRYEATVYAQAARLAAVEPVLRAYREQHDICAADPDEGFDRCPCEICDAVVSATGAPPGESP